MEMIFEEKTIDSLSEDDTNVHIKGKISEVNTGKLLLQKCPVCRENVDEDEDGYYCQTCDEIYEEPDYILMVPTTIDDGTSEISATFFGNLAEELIGMTKEEVLSDIEEYYDGISEKIEGLVINKDIEIIADVGMDNYTQEYRLTPKKILNK